MTDSHSSTEIQTELSRDLGLVSALAIGVGTMIAAGIFSLSGLAVNAVGSAAVLAFGLAAVVATFTALTYCEFSSIYPHSGEGYLYARKTFAAPVAYLVGWCLVLGYVSSCGFYVASFSAYFNEFVWHSPFEPASGLVIVGALTLLNVRGTKESGGFQIVVTAAKVGLLIWFVAGGMGSVTTEVVVERFSTDVLAIGSTAALVFITFFGFSAIAASAGEVRNPTRTIPLAIFISMGLVSVLYVAVILVVVAAGLTSYDEAAMGRAAEQFLGPIGGNVIVAGALFSMVSAANASIMAGSRVALSMSRLGHLPREIGIVNEHTKTPIVALLLTGTAIGGFSVVMDLENLAHFADVVLLIVLTLVNAALIRHRRLFPDLARPFRVPLVPLLPALGILANLYLLSQVQHLLPVVLALGAIGAGLAGFVAWKGTQPAPQALPGKPSRVALERAAISEGRFRVLVPIANPATVGPLVELAACIAGARQGEVVALRVITVPDQIAPSEEDAHVERERQLLETARARAAAHGVPCTSIVRVGHSTARAILETARERQCDLIVLGWKGHTTTAQRLLGDVTDDVVMHARADIILVKRIGDRPLSRCLLPSAGGEHAVRAQEYAADIVRAAGGSLTLCSVVPPDAEVARVDAEEQRLAEARGQVAGVDTVETRLIRSASVSDGIVETSTDYDAVIIGAANQSHSAQILFGSIPEEIALRSDRPVLVVKRHHAIKNLVGRVME